MIFRDHKPLTFTLHTKSDRYSPREIRHLDLIPQFTSDIRHINGTANVPADALSSLPISVLTPAQLDMVVLAADQPQLDSLDPSTSELSGCHFVYQPLATSDCSILCETSTGSARPFVPVQHHYIVFTTLHSLAHPGIIATLKLVKDHFFLAQYALRRNFLNSFMHSMSEILGV